MGTSTPALAATLGAMVGGRARPATPDDVVAGMQPRGVVEPAGEDEVAATVAFADHEGLSVLVRGGGSQLDLGFPPPAGDIVLTLSRMPPLREHNAPVLTATLPSALPL